jgi:hypothetical protein
LITTHESTEKTRKLAKHQLLDPNVFNDVNVAARAARDVSCRGVPPVCRGVKSVANLMTYEKIVEIIADVFEVRKT